MNPQHDLDLQRWQRLKQLVTDALELPAAQRSAFARRACADDPALLAELESLIAAAAASPGLLEHAPATALGEALGGDAARDRSGQRLGAWRLLSLLAHGGMGEVWRAERADGQYEQQAALKLVRDGAGTQALLERFNAERRILATLDHPNLAKLVDAGVAGDGTPWFVMDLVEGGLPIDQWCEARSLDVDARVRLFRTVCQVVDYAHRQGVVHRDLKPGNILVNRDGVVKLVDFGIAKRVDAVQRPSEQTATLQRALTPEYASPEQVRGEAVTPASDIYALGVVLYRLLTRASPYGSATTDDYALTRAICDTEPPRPSRALPDGAARPQRRRLEGDLDAVVLMALRKQPAHRYASAEALADDLFRHLEGLPVQARRGAWSYRAGRFVLRHRAAVGAVAVANLALLAGIAFAAWQTYEARLQRERAEHHFASVRKLANVMLRDLHDAIRTLPGSTPARKLLVESGLGYLSELGTEARGDRALQAEIAAGYRNIGDIQGRPGLANLGDMQGALKSYGRAIDLLKPVLEAPGPRDAVYRDAQQELVVLYQRRGGLLGSVGRLPQGLADLHAGVALADELAAADPSSRRRRLLRATLYGQLSQIQMFAADIDGFFKTSAAAASQLEPLFAQDPTDRDAGINLATNYSTLGEHYIQRDMTRASAELALASFRKAAGVLAKLVAANPDNSSLARALAVARENIGWSLLRTGAPQAAADSVHEGLALLERLVAQDPDSTQFRADLASAQSTLADAQLALGRAADGVRWGEAAVKSFEGLPASVLDDSYVHYHKGLAYHVLGRALEAAHRHGAACERERQSLPIMEEMDKQGIPPGDVGPAAVREALAGCRS